MTASMNEPWNVQLLGGLRARQGEERLVTRFRTQSTGVLLAYLAYHKGRSHPREVLIELLWPDVPPEKGRHNLSNALSSLRNQLEPPGVTAGSVLVTDRLAVELNPVAVTTDVEAFEQGLRRAALVRGSTPTAVGERAEHLARAVESYGGPLLPGYYEEWIMGEQARLAGRFLDAVFQLVRLHEQHGATNTALEYARRAVSADPASEEAHREVIRLLLARGEPAAALRQYRELERCLKDDVGEEPAPATRQLLRQAEEQLGRESPSSPAATVAAPTPPPPTSSSEPNRRLPGGTVTFLLTDIEDSTAGWSRAGDAFRAALERHHALLRECVSKHGGHEVSESGDAFLIAFGRASDALACAIEAQQALASEPWPDGVESVGVRMALHTGEAVPEADGNYHGLVVNRAARILAAAHAGQVLCSAPTAELLRPHREPEVPLSDLGLYRLRGLDEPERLFLVQYEGMAGQEVLPPAAERAHSNGSVPLQFTRFFGREQEIAEIERLARAPDVRLVTLSGPGGTGKTRLAVEAAGRLLESLSGAVWFVPLADLSDSALLVGAVADALRLSQHEGDADPSEQVVAALSEHPALLVLDNLEHLVENGGAEWVQTLLARVPDLTILVTSRQLLGLAGEHELVVEPLPTPNGNGGPEQLSLFDSVRLFVDRAQQVKADFQITSHNAPAVAELCDRLEGIPLAIELAAARAQVLTPSQMLARLSDRFELLVSRKRGVTARQRTLRAAVDWSYQLLDPDLQRFFARLSVFRGGWTVEAAEQVCEEPLALDYLALLRDNSLVRAESASETIRFGMLDTLREFGWERLPSEEQVSVRRCHAEYFFQLAQEASTSNHADGPQLRPWLERLDAEYPNLSASLEWYAAEPSGSGARAGLEMVAALFPFWRLRGYLAQAWRWCATALAHPDAANHRPARAEALKAAGQIAQYQGDWAEARVLYEERLTSERDLGNRSGVADALWLLANVSDPDEARAFQEECLSINRQIGNVSGIVSALIGLGDIATDQNDRATAEALYEEAVSVAREQGKENRGGREDNRDYRKRRSDLARALQALGRFATEQSQYERAHVCYQESLRLWRELSAGQSIASTLGSLAYLAQRQGDRERARDLFGQQLALKRELGDQWGVADTLRSLGHLAHHEDGNFAGARTQYLESLAVWRDMGEKTGVALTLMDLAQIACSQGHFAEGRTRYRESIALWKEGGNRKGLALTLAVFANCLVKEVEGTQNFRQAAQAAQLMGAAQALRMSVGSPASEDAVYENEAATLRAFLGQAEFDTAFQTGQTLSWDQITAIIDSESSG